MTTATLETPEIQDCLAEGEILTQILEVCDREDIDYFEGFVAAIGLDNTDERVNPARLIYNILCTDGEMSEREAVTVLDNAIRGVFECIAEREDEDGVK